MTHLFLTTRLSGVLVDEHLCVLREGMSLGEGVEADLVVLGPTLILHRVEQRWFLGEHALIPQHPLTLTQGKFEITAELTQVCPSVKGREFGAHLMMLVATLALILGGAWIESVQQLIEHNPKLTGQLQALLVSTQTPVQTVEINQELELPNTFTKHYPAVEHHNDSRPPAKFVP